MHNSKNNKQKRNISTWDKTLLASARNTVVPEHKKLPYDWIKVIFIMLNIFFSNLESLKQFKA